MVSHNNEVIDQQKLDKSHVKINNKDINHSQKHILILKKLLSMSKKLLRTICIIQYKIYAFRVQK